MSDYRNFAHDLAERCQDILHTFMEPARDRDREVTFLLLTAAGGFLMSYERLRPDQRFPQPSLDRECYSAARDQLRGILDERVGDSNLLDGQPSWRGGALALASGPPDAWTELQKPSELSSDASVSEVVRQLRHAMAHGNVLTRSGRTTQIAQLVFVSGGVNSIPLRYVLVSPTDFTRFLSNWFAVVADLPLPYHEVLEVVAEAA